MSTEIVTQSDNGATEINSKVFSTPLAEGEVTLTPTAIEWLSSTESVNNNSMGDKHQFSSESKLTLTAVLQAFIIIEIVMTALELILSTLAAFKVARWRRNYRNQMLMQLSLVRFIKRVCFLIEYLNRNGTISDSEQLKTMLISSQVYLDFVVVILVSFFIKHMYDSLILVLVKINQHKLIKVVSCAWLLPVPISFIATAIIVYQVLSQWLVYLLICCIFRWPLMFIGTVVYITILYSIMFDDKRRFARSLTVITFSLCLVINLYLFSKDVIWLWCFESFSTLLISYILGLILNFLILCLYLALIIFSFQLSTKVRHSNSMPGDFGDITQYKISR